MTVMQQQPSIRGLFRFVVILTATGNSSCHSITIHNNSLKILAWDKYKYYNPHGKVKALLREEADLVTDHVLQLKLSCRNFVSQCTSLNGSWFIVDQLKHFQILPIILSVIFVYILGKCGSNESFCSSIVLTWRIVCLKQNRIWLGFFGNKHFTSLT